MVTGAKPPKVEVTASKAAVAAMFLQAGEGFLRSEERVVKADDRLAAKAGSTWLTAAKKKGLSAVPQGPSAHSGQFAHSQNK